MWCPLIASKATLALDSAVKRLRVLMVDHPMLRKSTLAASQKPGPSQTMAAELRTTPLEFCWMHSRRRQAQACTILRNAGPTNRPPKSQRRAKAEEDAYRTTRPKSNVISWKKTIDATSFCSILPAYCDGKSGMRYSPKNPHFFEGGSDETHLYLAYNSIVRNLTGIPGL